MINKEFLGNKTNFKDTPCPVCGKLDHRCLRFEDSQIHNCYTFKDNHSGVVGFTFSKTTHNGWGVWYPNGGITRVPYEEVRKQQDKSYYPSAEEFHKEYSVLTSQLTLDAHDTADLSKRGVPEAILKAPDSPFKTIEQGFRFSQQNKLVGFNSDKRATNYSSPKALLVPCYSPEGLIHGYHLKGRVVGNSKYFSPTGQDSQGRKLSAHTQKGEVYSTTVHFGHGVNKTNGGDLWLTEGHLKPLVAASRHGIATFGYGGGSNFLPKQLQATLNFLKPTRVILGVDAGSSKLNKQGGYENIVVTTQRYYEFLTKQGYEVKVADWGQFHDKSVGDLDDVNFDFTENKFPDKEIRTLKYVDIEEYLPLTEEALIEKFSKLANENTVFEKGQHYLFANPSVAYDAVRNSSNKLIKIYHDKSGTGVGKSYAVGELSRKPNERIVHASLSPRNLTIDKLRDFQLLSGRHNGIWEDANGNLTTVEIAGQKPVQPPNCKFSYVFNYGRSVGADTGSFCTSCPERGKCQNGEGDGYGYKYNMSKSFGAARLRATPTSLNEGHLKTSSDKKQKVDRNGDPYPIYEETTLFIDEFTSVNSTQQHTVVMGNAMENSALAGRENTMEIFKFLCGLIRNMDAENLTSAVFVSLLTTEALKCIKAGAIEFRKERVVKVEKAISKFFKDEWVRKTRKDSIDSFGNLKNNLGRNHLAILSQIVEEQHFSVTDYEENKASFSLTMTSVNSRVSSILKAADRIVVQDATTPTEDIAAFFGVDISEIVTLESVTKTVDNVTYKEITDLGKLTSRRSNTQIDIVEQLKERLPSYLGVDAKDVGYIDFKKFETDKAENLRFFSTGRGSNKFSDAGKKVLVIVGRPYANIKAIQSHYEALFQKVVEGNCEDEFSKYYSNRVCQEIIQNVGRLRNNRREGEKLQVIFVGSGTLPEIYKHNLESVSLVDILPEAQTRLADSRRRINTAAEFAKDLSRDVKLTQRLLSEVLGINESSLKQWVKRNFNSWEAFLTEVYLKMEEFPVSPELEKTPIMKAIRNRGDELVNDLKKLHSEFNNILTQRELEKVLRGYHDDSPPMEIRQEDLMAF